VIRPARAIDLILPAIAAVGALTAGCGGPASTGTPLAKSHVSAYARAINLRSGDVAGMSITGRDGETSASDLTVRLARCGGSLPGWEVGSLYSARFSRAMSSSRVEAVWSAIRVAPSAAVAQRSLAANETPPVRACVAHAFRAALGQRGPLVRESMAGTAIPIELPGAKGRFGLRLTRRLRYLDARHKPPEHNLLGEMLARINGARGGEMSWDVIGFSAGAVEVALTDFHGPHGTPVRTERRLLSLLYSRAKANKL
jgi:hypothetical protein